MGRRLGLVSSVAIAVAVGATGGSAFAYFTASGSGSGTAQVFKASTVIVNAATRAADLLPGGVGAAAFTLHNSNPFAVSFSSVTAASVASDNTSLCQSSNVSIAKTMPYTLSPALTVDANTTSGTVTIPGLVQLSSSAPSSCQGVTFTVTLTLTGASQ